MRVIIGPLEGVQELGGGVDQHVVSLAPDLDGSVQVALQQGVAVFVGEHLHAAHVAFLNSDFNGGGHGL